MRQALNYKKWVTEFVQFSSNRSVNIELDKSYRNKRT